MSSQPTNHDAARLAATNRLTEASRNQPANHQLGEAIQEEARQRRQRYTVQEAAEVLGTSVDAVRGRIRRGTLDSLKVDGVVYVLLDSTNQERQSDKTTTDADEKQQQTVEQSELEGVMNPRRGCRSLAGGRGKRRRQSAAPPKWRAASRNPSLAVETAMPMRNPAPRPSGAVVARSPASPLRT